MRLLSYIYNYYYYYNCIDIFKGYSFFYIVNRTTSSRFVSV
jgi:hypothetical protein